MHSIFDDEFDNEFDNELISRKSNSWIYIGADIRIKDWSKVGKTTRGLNTRHTSSQNPGYFIYSAFNIINGNVHDIEYFLHKYLESCFNIRRQSHFSTGTKSECFELNPDQMAGIVEQYISDYYGSCVAYETTLHDGMSRYICPQEIQNRYINNFDPSYKPLSSLLLNKNDYFSGNQEVYEIDLGGGNYQDIATGRFFFRDEE